MNIFFNISHPAHFHFFKHAIAGLKKNGHQVVIGTRKKEFAIDLLKTSGWDYSVLTAKGDGALGRIVELLLQQIKISHIIRKHKIELMLQISGIFNAPAGRMHGIPTLAFSDTENDILTNKISFALSRHVLSPSCFKFPTGVPWKNQILYPGYHELAYLGPEFIGEMNKPESKFLVRFVGWGAFHDIGEASLSREQKIQLVALLKKFGEVFISSEGPLPEEIKEHEVRFHPSEMHEFMKSCKLIVGESATMASEAACLGIPAVFISNTGRGYTTEQDEKYGLIKHFRVPQWQEIKGTLEDWASKDMFEEWQDKRKKMLREKIKVTSWIMDLVEDYPRSIKEAKAGRFEKYRIEA